MVFSCGLFACPAWAARTLSCEADYGGKTYRLDARPTDDVFAFQQVDLGTRFRFSIQWLESQMKLKTFAYLLTERAPLLIHTAEYPLPSVGCPSPTMYFGRHKVYASDLERELFFECSAVCE